MDMCALGGVLTPLTARFLQERGALSLKPRSGGPPATPKPGQPGQLSLVLGQLDPWK